MEKLSWIRQSFKREAGRFHIYQGEGDMKAETRWSNPDTSQGVPTATRSWKTQRVDSPLASERSRALPTPP